MSKKTLHNLNGDDAKKNVPDVKFFGDPDAFKLICKAISQGEGWMKSTKAMEIPGVGCLVQVTTQQLNPDRNSYAVAEALTFVPGACIEESEGKRRLVSFEHAARKEPVIDDNDIDDVSLEKAITEGDDPLQANTEDTLE